jgi:hypothetical protein
MPFSSGWTKEKEKKWLKYQRDRINELLDLYDPNGRGHVPKVVQRIV